MEFSGAVNVSVTGAVTRRGTEAGAKTRSWVSTGSGFEAGSEVGTGGTEGSTGA